MTGFDWDPIKALGNRRKHRVDFADAATAFDDPRAITIRDPDASGEERFLCLAADLAGRVLVTVFTWRGPAIRIISSRRASRREQSRYRAGK